MDREQALTKAVCVACLDGDVERLHSLLAYSPNLAVRDPKGRTAMHAAAFGGNPDCILPLVRLHIPVDAADSEDAATPLHYACAAGQQATTSQLIDLGASINKKDDFYRTPVYYAVANGHSTIVSLLHGKRAQLHTVDRSGATPLHYAAYLNELDCARTLLDLVGAKASLARDRKGRTPLHYAALGGHTEMIGVLHASGANLMVADRMGLLPVHAAACSGRADAVQVLDELLTTTRGLDAQEVTMLRDGKQRTVCHLAATRGFWEIVSDQLRQSVDVEARDAQGRTMLHNACSAGDEDSTELLLQRGANVDARDTAGNTPLMCACGQGRVRVVDMLLKAGASCHLRNESGDAALHFACYTGCVSSVAALLAAGADARMANGDGRLPLHVVASAGSVGVCRVLLEHFGDDETVGAVVDAQGRTVLHAGASAGRTLSDHHLHHHHDANGGVGAERDTAAGILMTLLGVKGANPLLRDALERTPLHYAAMRGDASACHLLTMTWPSPADMDDSAGCSPLFYAAATDSTGSCTRCLLHAVRRHQAIERKQARTAARKALSVEEIPTRRAQGNDNSDSSDSDSVDSDDSDDIGENADAPAPPLSVVARTERTSQRTPIHVAALHGHLMALRLLLEAAPTEALNLPDAQGHTALHLAAAGGHTTAVECLLLAGADSNVCAEGGFTALAIASALGHVEPCRLLAQTSSNLDEPATEHEWTPLHLAAIAGHSRVVDLLVCAGSDTDAQDTEDCTPLMLAAAGGHDACVDSLGDCDIDCTSGQGQRTALMIAAAEGHSTSARLIVAHGGDVSRRDAHGRTALHIAAAAGHADVCSVLADDALPEVLTAADSGGFTALHLACYAGHADAVRALLTAASDLDGQMGEEGDEVRRTLSAPSLNEGLTPWHCATLNAHVPETLIEVLSEVSAHVEANTGHGLDPLTCDLRGRTALHAAAMMNSAEACTALAAYVPQILNVRDRGREWTAAMLACRCGSVEVVEALIANNADMSVRDAHGNTVLHAAALMSSEPDCLSHILGEACHVDELVNTVNAAGETPLHIAARARDDAALTMVEQLIESGASVDVCSGRGTTPAQEARQAGHDVVADYIASKQQQQQHGAVDDGEGGDDDDNGTEVVPSEEFISEHRNVLRDMMRTRANVDEELFEGVATEDTEEEAETAAAAGAAAAVEEEEEECFEGGEGSADEVVGGAEVKDAMAEASGVEEEEEDEDDDEEEEEEGEGERDGKEESTVRLRRGIVETDETKGSRGNARDGDGDEKKKKNENRRSSSGNTNTNNRSSRALIVVMGLIATVTALVVFQGHHHRT